MLLFHRCLKKKKSDLSFEDSGVLKDQMDRKADALLRKAGDASAVLLGPALASTCIARKLDVWVHRQDDLLPFNTPVEEDRESLPPNCQVGGLSGRSSSRFS